MNYLQKKKQAIIMMLAAQIIKTAQGYPVTVNDCESGTAVDYTVWGNTIADGDTVMYVGDKTKNLIPYPYHESTKTVNGITFTDNGDGSVTVSGTATEYVAFNFVQALPCRPNQAYTVVKNSVDVNNVSFVFCDVNENGKITRETVSTTRERTFTVTTLASTAYIKLLMKRQNNAECTGTVKPTLELGTTATEYEPYTESYVGDKTLVSDNTYKYKIPIVNSGNNDREDTLINIYLDKPLKKGESINFGADNLPELQLFEGSNVITADTAVKPSDIEIRYTVKQ